LPFFLAGEGADLLELDDEEFDEEELEEESEDDDEDEPEEEDEDELEEDEEELDELEEDEVELEEEEEEEELDDGDRAFLFFDSFFGVIVSIFCSVGLSIRTSPGGRSKLNFFS
jgi:hypothetical protein